MSKILLVEDDSALSATTEEWLKMERYTVECAFNGTDAMEMLRSFDYDLVVLDWELPEMTGIEILKQFRARGGKTPVIMLTGKSAIYEKEIGFETGADDYLTKPFHPKELAARVKALLRRPRTYTSELLEVNNVTVDPNTHLVTKSGQEVSLQPMEFALLEFFLRHPGQVFSPEALLRRVWDSESEASLDAIYTCIRRIRKKLDENTEKSVIRTVHGVGYRLGP